MHACLPRRSHQQRWPCTRCHRSCSCSRRRSSLCIPCRSQSTAQTQVQMPLFLQLASLRSKCSTSYCSNGGCVCRHMQGCVHCLLGKHSHSPASALSPRLPPHLAGGAVSGGLEVLAAGCALAVGGRVGLAPGDGGALLGRQEAKYGWRYELGAWHMLELSNRSTSGSTSAVNGRPASRMHQTEQAQCRRT